MKRILWICLVWMFLPFDSAWALGKLPPEDPLWNFQGLWWSAREPGWGMNVTHQHTTLFATWFTYDAEGNGQWLVMPNLQRGDSWFTYDEYYGPVYRGTGPAFDATPWDRLQVELTQVGSANFHFNSGGTGLFSYMVDGTPGMKEITRQVFSSPVPDCIVGGYPGPEPNFTDLWWRSPAGMESGWGVNIEHQGDIVFATWFTYDIDGNSDWLVMSRGVRVSERTYAGALYRTRGPELHANPWDPSKVTVAEVGSATFAFTTEEEAMFTYTLDGVSQSKPITRQVFAVPTSVCH